MRLRLKKTEEELNQLRTDSGILSLADATSTLSSQRARTQEDLMNAKANFAEQKSNIESLEKNAAENAAAVESNDKDAKGISGQTPPQVVSEYRAIMDLLAFFQKRDLELRVKFKSGNRLVANNQEQFESYDAKRRALIAKYPDLAAQAEVVEQGRGPKVIAFKKRRRKNSRRKRGHRQELTTVKITEIIGA